MTNIKTNNNTPLGGGKSKKSPQKPPAGGKSRPGSAPTKGGGAAHGNAVSSNTMTGPRQPKTMMKNGSTIVTHTETYGINVTGTSGFSLFSTWAIQPGLTSYSNGSPLGSWLPQIANNFDNYEITSLKFGYRAACSTLQPGLIVFGFEPNPEGGAPATYQELRNMYSADGSAHANLSFDVSGKCRKPLLTRKSAVVNLPTYDSGKVYMATVGCDEGAKLGFVDVHYTIRLFNPQSGNSTLPLPKVVGVPVLPELVVSNLVPDSSTHNAATNCNGVWDDFLNGPNSASAGAAIGVIAATTKPALSLSLGNGHSFTEASGFYRHFAPAYPGRYRMTVNLPLEFEDLKLFSMCPLVLRGGTWTVTKRQVYSDVLSTSAVEVNNVPVAFRGFTGVASLDPNPGTDIGFLGQWDMALEVGDQLVLAVGVRTYNSVSTSTANIKFPTGLGGLQYTLAFIGPSVL